MRFTSIAITMMLALTLVGAAGCTAQPAEQPETTPPAETPAATPDDGASSGSDLLADPAALLQAKCSQCHGIEQATSEDRDEAGWNAIVDDMVARGLQITPEERDVLVPYLAEAYGK